MGIGVSQAPDIVMREDLVVADQIVEQDDVVEGGPAIVESFPGVESVWGFGGAGPAVRRITKEGVPPVEDDVFVEHVEMAGGTVADPVATAVPDGAGAVQGFGHEDEVPFPGAGLVDGVLPELGGKALGEIATETVDADVGLAFGGGSLKALSG